MVAASLWLHGMSRSIERNRLLKFSQWVVFQQLVAVPNLVRWQWLAILLVLSSGCSSHWMRLSQPRRQFYDGQISEARQSLEKMASSWRRDRDVAALDLAMVELFSGNPKGAERKLRMVRDRFDELEGPQLAASTIALWTDDQVRAYAGEDYEKIFLRCFLTLANLLDDGEDVEAYSLQTDQKQKELALAAAKKLGDQEQERYRDIPCAAYLRGIFKESTHRDYEEAAACYRKVAEQIGEAPPLMADLQRATSGVHSRRGNGVFYLFALVGHGPYKVEQKEHATSDALLVADRVLSAIGPHTLPPTLAPIKITAIASPAQSVDRIGVAVNRNYQGETWTITDFQQIASELYEVKRKELMARAVVRRVLKKATVYTAKEAMGGTDGVTSLVMDGAGVLWEAAEQADTRCWGLLPSQLQVLRIELPEGVHSIRLLPMLHGQIHGTPVDHSIAIGDGLNTYGIVYFPDGNAIGGFHATLPGGGGDSPPVLIDPPRELGTAHRSPSSP
jgi:hypothetical protein